MLPKETKGKWQPRLVLTSLEEEVAKARAFGISKYKDENGWHLSSELEYLEAAIRHCKKALKSFQKKNPKLMYDDESGLNHYAHAACCLMFCIDKLEDRTNDNPKV